MIFSRFFYNVEVEGGGGATDTVVDTATPVAPELSEEIKAQLQELQELREFKKNIAEKEPTKTPEQLAKEAEIEKADLLKFSAENDLMKVDDFAKYESLKAKADRDLVFEGYISQWKEENPDITDEAEIEAQAKAEFENEYKLNSDNEKAKSRGMAKLTKEANELRSPLENTYKVAKERFSEAKNIKATYPKFNDFIDGQVKAISDKITLFKTKDGEEEIPIEVELTKEEREEISKTFKNPKVFHDFINGKPDELKAKLEKKINSFIKEKKFEEVNQKVWAAAHGRGVLKGSAVGAENSFALQQSQTKTQAKVLSLEESNAKAAERREKLGY